MWKNVRLLFGKEIVGALRDRRTLILTIFFPLIFYPLILAVMSHFAATEELRIGEFIPTVIIVDRAQDETFRAHLRDDVTFHSLHQPDEEEGRADLKAGFGQVMMTVDKESGGPGLGLVVGLYYDQTNQIAAIAVGRVRSFLQGYLSAVLRDRLDLLGLDYDELTPPLRVSMENVASGESIGRIIMSRLLPYFMILAILTGAMGLGAEITAGEKERGTIATLLVSQLSRTEIVLGKFFTVFAVSLVSSILSAVGLLIGVRFFGGGLTPAGTEATFSLSLSAFGWMLGVLIPLAVILSALVVIVGSFARNQKEASTYLMPIYMVIVLVGLVSMTGGVTFTGARFLIPVANALYALQEIIVGDLHFMNLFYTLLANVLCGGLLIAASIQLFKREAVLFRG